MKILYDTWLARFIGLFGFTAITIGGVVHSNQFVAPTSPLYKHEAKHVEQQKNLGWLFYVQYVLWFIVQGYWNNPFEVEARKAEK